MTPTTPAALGDELRQLARSGATLAAVEQAPHLLGLEVCRAKAASDAPADIAVAALDLVREVAGSFEEDERQAISTLLSLDATGRGRLLMERRQKAANKLHISLDHFRREREPLLLQAAADELFRRDSAWRRRRQRDAEGTSYDPRLGIDWLAQHRTYRRIWTPIQALRADLLLLIERFQALHAQGRDPYDVEPDDRYWISDRLASMAWRLAQFSTAMVTFVEEQGGLWLLSDPTHEAELSQAAWELEAKLPFGEGDLSWLRTMLRDTPDREFEGFADRLLAAGTRRQELMSAWVDWVWENRADVAATCTSAALRCTAWLKPAEVFIEILDADRLHRT